MKECVGSLRLIAILPEVAEALRGDNSQFEAAYGCMLEGNGDFVREVVDVTLAHLQKVPRRDPFGCFLVTDSSGSKLVGTCGFKHGPNERGEVEIAYFTFPENEGKGWATAMARTLVELAEADRAVSRVIAHTLPVRNASCRVLEKNGFVFVGGVVDPEDGPVWRWERERCR